MPKAIFEVSTAASGKIQEGTYSYQELLPPRASSRRIWCSRNTLRRAVSMLADDATCSPCRARRALMIWQPQTHSAQGSLEGVESFGRVRLEKRLCAWYAG